MKIPKIIKITPRVDNIANWHYYNPIIRDKELCCVINDDGSYKWKIGDGINTYEDLPFVEAIDAIQHFIVYSTCGIVSDINLAPQYKNEVIKC